MVSPVPCCGVIVCSNLPPVISGRRFVSDEHFDPFRSEDIYLARQTATNQYKSLYHRQAPRVSDQNRGKGINLLAVVGP